MFRNLAINRLGMTGTQSEIIEFALSFGFTGIDLDLVDFSRRVTTHGMVYARRYLNSAPLALSSYRLPISLGAEEAAFADQLAALPSLLENAVALDCRRAIVEIEPASDERLFHDNFELHRRRINQLTSLLQGSETQLGLQWNPVAAERADGAHEFIHTFETAFGLLGMIEGEVGLVVDLWGLYASGETDAWGSLRVDQIASVLVADAPADKPLAELTDADRLLPSESGTIDVVAALRMLSAMGYQGPLTPVPHRSSFGSTKREAVVQETGRSLVKLWDKMEASDSDASVATASA